MASATYRIEYPNGTFFEVDLGPILELDARKQEIAGVSRVTGPELMRAMEDGFTTAGKLHASALLEQTKVQGMLDRRRAEVSLDIAPEVLKQKGLLTSRAPAGTEEQRESILALDVPMNKLKESMAHLEAVTNLLKVHMRGFEMAFTAVKKAIDHQMQQGMFTPEQTETLIRRGSTGQPPPGLPPGSTGGLTVRAGAALPSAGAGIVGKATDPMEAGDDIDYSEFGIVVGKAKGL